MIKERDLMKKRIKGIIELIRIKFFQPFFRKMCGWNELEENFCSAETQSTSSVQIINKCCWC